MRRIPDVRSWRQLAKLPAFRQVVIGLFLLGPAGLWVAGAPNPASAPAAVEPTAAEAEVEAVTRAWAARQLEHQRAATITKLASEFDVSLTLAADIHDAAVSEEIDPRMAFGLVRAESSFRPRAISPVGAVGLTQLMPATARWVEPGTRRNDLMEPETNLRVGFKYLRQLLEQYGGDHELALTAYNRGPGTVDRLLKRGSDPDNGYADKVLTGSSPRHVALMNAKFGRRKSGKRS